MGVELGTEQCDLSVKYHRYRAQEGWVTVARLPRRRPHPILLWHSNKRLGQGSPLSAPLTSLGGDSETKRFL